MQPPPPFPQRVTETLERLRAARIRVHIIGGALRDGLLGRPIRDFDLVVDCDLATAKEALPGCVSIPARSPLLLITAKSGDPGIEIAAARSSSSDLRADLEQRDFTLNAIAFDPEHGRWVDPLGGRADLAARRLVAVRPPRTFDEDPIRILRGVRFVAELGLETDPATTRAMELGAHRLHHSPGERISWELMRLLSLDPPSAGLLHLRRIGALAVVLPELLRGVAIAQNRHHREDVFRHSLRVCDGLSPEPLLRLAALLHDAGKPETKRFDARRGDWSFHRHEHLAAPHIERVATRLRLSNRDTALLHRLVRHHLLSPDRLATLSARRRMLRRVGRDILPQLIELRRADLAAHDPEGRVPRGWSDLEPQIQELLEDDARAPVRLAIGGKEIMMELGVKSGPDVGRWLKRLERRVTEHPEENERDLLLAWLRSFGTEH